MKYNVGDIVKINKPKMAGERGFDHGEYWGRCMDVYNGEIVSIRSIHRERNVAYAGDCPWPLSCEWLQKVEEDEYIEPRDIFDLM